MKRFWLILLSLGLIVAFSTSAMAVDVKFSGEYYAAGMYLDKTNVTKNVTVVPPGEIPPVTFKEGSSTAFYFQRLRLNTTFVVSPGLMLITRADIMERAWGANRSTPGTAYDTLSNGTTAENENIAFDWMYVTYVSPIGAFSAGYQNDQAWGTVFGDNSTPNPKITYALPIGPVVLGLQTGKATSGGENSYTAKNTIGTGTDQDNNFYTAFARYAWKGGDAGFLFRTNMYRATRDVAGDIGYQTNAYVLLPYVKAQLGPVALQAEVNYAMGKTQNWEGTGNPYQDVKLRNLIGWVDAVADFGMVYVGGSFAYVSGDDPATTDKAEGGVLNGGLDWKPCLIMFNSDLNYWVGSQSGYGYISDVDSTVKSTANGAPMTNAYFAQLRGGIRPVEKLDIMASVSYATADKTPAAYWDSREYGYEVDLTGTYKITNNLSYMLGAGYWFVGDFYKGQTTEDVNDNFMVINKLTLTF